MSHITTKDPERETYIKAHQVGYMQSRMLRGTGWDDAAFSWDARGLRLAVIANDPLASSGFIAGMLFEQAVREVVTP